LASGKNTLLRFADAFSDMKELLLEYGPGLVRKFQVEKSFISNSTLHIGRKNSVTIGSHAMLLVGVREEGNQLRYLLQNWWKKKPFVEVDFEYLLSCQPSINFVITKQTEIGNYSTNFHDHVECELLDAPEMTAALEWMPVIDPI
jgi:hypothetical protein